MSEQYTAVQSKTLKVVLVKKVRIPTMKMKIEELLEDAVKELVLVVRLSERRLDSL